MTTGDHTPRLDVLADEIAWNEARLSAMGSPMPPDPLAKDWLDQLDAATAHSALTQTLEAQRTEQSRLLHGALHLRLTGRPVQGTTVAADVVERVIRNIRHLAESLGAFPRIGIPAPGSHIVEVVPEPQRQLGDPFGQTSEVLLDAFAAAHGTDPMAVVRELAEQALPATVQALSTLVNGIAKDGLEVQAESENAGARRRVGLDRTQANELARALSDAKRELKIEVVTGKLGGALEGAGRFEISIGAETLEGSVPTTIRSDLDGLTLGRLVRATIQRSTTTYTAGRPSRESISLVAIEALDDQV